MDRIVSEFSLEQALDRQARRRRVWSFAMLAILLVALLGSSLYPYLVDRSTSPESPAGETSVGSVTASVDSPDGKASGEQAKGPDADPFAELEQVTRAHPKDVEALTALANRYFDHERWSDAEGTYRKVLALVPGDPEVGTDLGTSLFYQHKTLEAIAAFRSVLETHPRKAQTRINLGIAYHSLGQTAKAVAEWKVAREVATDDEARKTAETFLARVDSGK